MVSPSPDEEMVSSILSLREKRVLILVK